MSKSLLSIIILTFKSSQSQKYLELATSRQIHSAFLEFPMIPAQDPPLSVGQIRLFFLASGTETETIYGGILEELLTSWLLAVTVGP